MLKNDDLIDKNIIDFYVIIYFYSNIILLMIHNSINDT
jgi:hypothetical protein